MVSVLVLVLFCVILNAVIIHTFPRNFSLLSVTAECLVMVDDGSECDVSTRDQSNNAMTASSSSSLSDSDTDALMVSQELRPGFSSDKDVSTGRGRSNRDSPDAHCEIDHQPDSTVDSNGQADGHFTQ